MTAAADELRRKISAALDEAVTFEAFVSRSWASITFSGERHIMALRLAGPGAGARADAFCAGLEDREFDLRGHVLADIAVAARSDEGAQAVRLALEALTVEMD